MVRRFFIVVTLFFVAFFFYKVVANYTAANSLHELPAHYVSKGATELGIANLVTAVIVTYRGFDTLGEVVVLFVSATGVGLLLRRRKEDEEGTAQHRKKKVTPASELVDTGAYYLMPLIFLLGVYIFANGHLTPGGGFQGGAVIASGTMLILLARPFRQFNHTLMHFLESLSGFGYIIIGVFGLVLAGGFLDNRFLPLGEFGTIFSGGAIPLIYTFIGLKVGTELSAVLDNLRNE